MSDATMAAAGRSLAIALMDFAYTRKEDDKKNVAACEHALCKALREEEAELQLKKEAGQ